jgi:hypothetical protein
LNAFIWDGFCDKTTTTTTTPGPDVKTTVVLIDVPQGVNDTCYVINVKLISLIEWLNNNRRRLLRERSVQRRLTETSDYYADDEPGYE